MNRIEIEGSEIETTYTCVLCGSEETGWGNPPRGNNPDPLNGGEGECCSVCNQKKVIPARFRMMVQQRGSA